MSLHMRDLDQLVEARGWTLRVWGEGVSVTTEDATHVRTALSRSREEVAIEALGAALAADRLTIDLLRQELDEVRLDLEDSQMERQSLEEQLFELRTEGAA